MTRRDEFGNVSGLVNLTDVMAAIVGDLPEVQDTNDPALVDPKDGTWLVDGGVEVDELERRLNTSILDEDDRRHYHTLGGMVMFMLARVPRVGAAMPDRTPAD